MRLPPEMRCSVFDIFHPAVQALYFVAVVALCMAAVHPVLSAMSAASAFALSAYLRGWRASLRSLAWLAPLVALVALFNPLFSSSGSTELYRLGARAVYGESIVYGACAGAMLAATLLWFSNASHILTSDRIMGLLGNTAPTLALMLSMAMRLVPRLARVGADIDAVQRACSAARPRTARERFASRVRTVSVLLGVSMEDSLETADAMRARYWGSSAERTVYARYRFRSRDAAAILVLAALTACAAWTAWAASTAFSFYPVIDGWLHWNAYIPYGLLLLAPFGVAIEGWLRWKR